MNWQTIIVILALCLSTAVGVGLFLLVWRRRQAAGALPFAALAAALAEWSLTYALEIGVRSAATKLLMAQFQYIGIALIPVMWFLFAQGYLRHETWLQRRRVAALLVVPAITILMAFTNASHHLLWAKIELSTDGPLRVMGTSYGNWWLIHLVYSYSLLLWGAVIIFQGIRSFSRVYRWQFFLLLFGLLLPWLVNGLYVTRLSPIPQLDLSPFSFALSFLILWLGIFQYHLFDLLPVTRSAIIERLNAAAFILDMKDRVVDINRAIRENFTPEGSQVFGEPVNEVFEWWGTLETQHTKAIQTQHEIALRQDGMKRTYSLQITPVWDQAQQLTGRLVILRDITSARLAEEALALAQVKTEFLAKVGHELRTPLTSLLGLTEMLEHGVYGPLTQNQRGAVGTLFDSTQRLIRLVSDLLEQARLERGSFQLEIVDFRIADLTDRLVKSLEPSARIKGLNLEIEIDPGMPAEQRGDPLRVYQILSNLVENAIKYTQKGKISVRIFCPNETHYTLQVSDTGIGIPKEALALIFDPFQQAKFASEFERSGFGLGLSIVKQLAMLMHGRVDVESEPGAGSRFEVTLPIEPEWEAHP
ncbi:MAG: histidine kinase N-terminal 7TM domain-containing protein [Chloroflexota bacterium]